jgi:DNA repair protein RadA
VDSIFGGNGIETGAVTEFYGAARTGKTQICFNLSVMVQQDQSKDGLSGKALFIDTENTFSPERIRSIAHARDLDIDKVLDNIFLAPVQHTLEQEITIEGFESIITTYTNIKLVIVDSVIRHYRVEFPGRSMLPERQQKLNIFMHQLSRIAATHRIAVVVTNQVQTSPDGLYNTHPQPTGGNVMAHTSTHRVCLRPSGENRTAKLVDSPYHPVNEVRFTITERGVEDIPDRL